MHTAICSFENRADADTAVQRLLDAGFDRQDVHLHHRHADGSAMGEHEDNDRWDGLEREVAVDRSRVRAFGSFFANLFGREHAHVEHYGSAVERGLYVVTVDGHDDARGERAQAILHGMNAADLAVVHRSGQRPLRDVVAQRRHGWDDSGQNLGDVLKRASYASESGPVPGASAERDRALAAEPARRTDGSEDADHAPGLRYADKDKPL